MTIDRIWIDNYARIRDVVSSSTSKKLSDIVKAAKVDNNPDVWWTIPLLLRYKTRRLTPWAVVALACAKDLINGFRAAQHDIRLQFSFPLIFTAERKKEGGVMGLKWLIHRLIPSYEDQIDLIKRTHNLDSVSPPVFEGLEQANTYSQFRDLMELVVDLEQEIYEDSRPTQQETYHPTKIGKVGGDDTPKHNGTPFSIKEYLEEYFCGIEAVCRAWREEGIPVLVPRAMMNPEVVPHTVTPCPEDGEALTTDQVLGLLDRRKTGPLKNGKCWIGCERLQNGDYKFFWLTDGKASADKECSQVLLERIKTRIKSMTSRVLAYNRGQRTRPRRGQRTHSRKRANGAPPNDMTQIPERSAAETSGVSGESTSFAVLAKEALAQVALVKKALSQRSKETSASASQAQDKTSISASKKPAESSKGASASPAQGKGKKKDNTPSSVLKKAIPKPYSTIGDAVAQVLGEKLGSTVQEDQQQQSSSVQQGEDKRDLRIRDDNFRRVFEGKIQKPGQSAKARQTQPETKGNTSTAEKRAGPPSLDFSLRRTSCAVPFQAVMDRIEQLEVQRDLEKWRSKGNRNNVEACTSAESNVSIADKMDAKTLLNNPVFLQDFMVTDLASESGQRLEKIVLKVLALRAVETSEQKIIMNRHDKLCSAAVEFQATAALYFWIENDPSGCGPLGSLAEEQYNRFQLIYPPDKRHLLPLLYRTVETTSDLTMEGWVDSAVGCFQLYKEGAEIVGEMRAREEADGSYIGSCQTYLELLEQEYEFCAVMARAVIKAEAAKTKNGEGNPKWKGKEKDVAGATAGVVGEDLKSASDNDEAFSDRAAALKKYNEFVEEWRQRASRSKVARDWIADKLREMGVKKVFPGAATGSQESSPVQIEGLSAAADGNTAGAERGEAVDAYLLGRAKEVAQVMHAAKLGALFGKGSWTTNGAVPGLFRAPTDTVSSNDGDAHDDNDDDNRTIASLHAFLDAAVSSGSKPTREGNEAVKAFEAQFDRLRAMSPATSPVHGLIADFEYVAEKDRYKALMKYVEMVPEVKAWPKHKSLALFRDVVAELTAVQKAIADSDRGILEKVLQPAVARKGLGGKWHSVVNPPISGGTGAFSSAGEPSSSGMGTGEARAGDSSTTPLTTQSQTQDHSQTDHSQTQNGQSEKRETTSSAPDQTQIHPQPETENGFVDFMGDSPKLKGGLGIGIDEEEAWWQFTERLHFIAEMDGIKEAFNKGWQKWKKGDPDLTKVVADLRQTDRERGHKFHPPKVAVEMRRMELAAVRLIAAAGCVDEAAADDGGGQAGSSGDHCDARASSSGAVDAAVNGAAVNGDAGASSSARAGASSNGAAPSGEHGNADGGSPDLFAGLPAAYASGNSRPWWDLPAPDDSGSDTVSEDWTAGDPSLRGGGLEEPDYLDMLNKDS